MIWLLQKLTRTSLPLSMAGGRYYNFSAQSSADTLRKLAGDMVKNRLWEYGSSSLLLTKINIITYMRTSSVHIWRAVSDFSIPRRFWMIRILQGINRCPINWMLCRFLERDGSVITGVVYIDVRFYRGLH